MSSLLQQILKHPLLLGSVIILSLLSVTATVFTPILIGQIVDTLADPAHIQEQELLKQLSLLAVIVSTMTLGQWALLASINRLIYSSMTALRRATFKKLQYLPLSYLDAHAHGDTINRIVTDIDIMTSSSIAVLQQVPTGILSILATLLAMFLLQPAIALFVALLTPLSIVLARLLAKSSAKFFRCQARQRSEVSSFVDEIVSSHTTVELFNRQKSCIEHFSHVNDKLCESSYRAVFFSSLANPTTRFVNALIYALLALVGSRSVLDGSISVGVLVAFLAYADQYAKPFNDISSVASELQNALSCTERVQELLDCPAYTSSLDDAELVTASTPSVTQGRVRLENLHFAYDKQKPVIKGLNLDVYPGQRIALVGATGCGKTSLMNLLMRFYELDEGTIYLDGKDIRKLSYHELRKQWGMVLQDSWIKDASVFENIALGRPDADRMAVEKAARRAHAHEFIERLPQGYDTICNKNTQLSAGQKQLLCIARVMLMEPPMLILDEATSHIDTRTELLVQSAFEQLLEGRTSFVVAHRLATIKHADAICVMDKGTIAEMGTHEQLLARGGLYARIYRDQFEAAL